MPAPLSVDLRQRVVDAYLKNDGTYTDIARRFGAGRASLNRWLRRFREAGSVVPTPTGGSASVLKDDDMEAIHMMVLDQPDLTLAQIAELLVADGGPRVSISILSRALGRLEMARKKSPSRRRSGSAPT